MTTSTAELVRTPYFFPVTRLKLAVMSIFTFNFYFIWWAFKNWLYVNDTKKKKVLPFIRAWFSPFFLHSLLVEMRESGKSIGFTGSFSPAGIYVGWLVIFLAGVIAEAFGSVPKVLANPELCVLISRTSLVLDFLGLFAVVPLLCAQKYINDLNLNANPDCEINSRFTKGNLLLLFISCSVMVVSLFGSVCLE